MMILVLCTGVSTTFASRPKLWHPCSLSYRSPTESYWWIQHPPQSMQAWVDLWRTSESWEAKSTSRLIWYLTCTSYNHSKNQSHTLSLWHTKIQLSWRNKSTKSIAKDPSLWQATNPEAYRRVSLCSSVPGETHHWSPLSSPKWSYTPGVQGWLKQSLWTQKSSSSANA